MARFQSIKLKQFAAVQDRETNEARYWKSFVLTNESKFDGTPQCIHFNPRNAGMYAVTGSNKVTLFDAGNDTTLRSISRFTDEAYSGKFRRDGKLIVAGDKSGYLKVFDVTTKAVLRQLKRHTAAVRAAGWTMDGLSMLSGSDDKTAKKWDLATQQVVWENHTGAGSSSGIGGGDSALHTDYVRSVEGSPVSSDVFVTGSHDHTVKLWDSRQSSGSGQGSSKCIFSFAHSAPVQQCSFTASGTMLVSAAGNELYLWDMLALGGGSTSVSASGGAQKSPRELMHKFCGHQKDVSSFTLDRLNHNRLLSCALDGHIKVFDLQALQVVHGLRYPDPLVSIALSQDCKKLIIGHVDGTISCRTRADDSRINVPAAMHQSLKALPPPPAKADAMTVEAPSDSTTAVETQPEETALQLLQAKFYQGAGAAVEIVQSSAPSSTSKSKSLSLPSSSSKRTSTSASSASSAVAVLETERLVRLRPYEVQLKKFQYQAALDSALRTRNPVIVITILEELCRRSGLGIALSGRDDESALEPLLSFIVRYVAHPRYSRVLVQVAHKVLDLYYHHATSAAAVSRTTNGSGNGGQHQFSDVIDELLYKLCKQVRQELLFQRQIMRVMGSLDAVIGAAGALRQDAYACSDAEGGEY